VLRLRKVFQTIFGDVFLKFHPKEKPDKKVLITFLVVAFSLVSIQYLNSIQKTLQLLHSLGLNDLTSLVMESLQNVNDYQLLDLNYWAMCSFFFYFIVPVLVIKFSWKEKISSYGLSLKGLTQGMRFYLLFLLIMLPLVWLASQTEQFQHSYPFYRLNYSNASYENLVIWECFYFLQFVGLEFFFRGFMVHALKKRFGYYSIFIMMIPYCMIHFGKPLPETIGAIFAGIVLGSMSLKSNSIWLGVLLHFSVAISMDFFAVWNMN
jgi:membrane protease YdiL (CAAX protease family)